MAFEAFEKLSADKKELILSAGMKEFSQKPYKEASTDSITKACGISKGLLFHYFGSKKAFYFYCLESAMEKLTAQAQSKEEVNDFYDILFSSMDQKFALCIHYYDEMHMVNMASRDAATEIVQQKAEMMQKYAIQIKMKSAETIRRALQTLHFKHDENLQMTVEGISLYINAVLNKYLIQYQTTPDAFFQNRDAIKSEMKQYLDMMLFGICQK
ncbi:MAG: TetR/AcrR family transcriptional regulator [Suilimivivens sp.]|nr:TetR/AcrR family transcriptional regulator [Lachnospiraceae bacterium]MDY5871234.1 TetR/AcrR family transcriptional regulator [Lachnospiraceae bacterium]